MHPVDDFQAREARVAYLGVLQALRNDADDLSTGSQRSVCDHAHEADRATTIDKRDALLGQGPAHRRCRFPINGIGSRAGAAEHTNRTQDHLELRKL